MTCAELVADDDRGALVSMLGMPGMGPHRIGVLIDHYRSATHVMEALARGVIPDAVDLRATSSRPELLANWRAAARAADPTTEVERHRRAGVAVLAPSDPWWPDRLVDDPAPPVLLFVAGDPALLDTPAVGVVGTRRCSTSGARIATALGAGLARRGLGTISGLALGIDGAAHRGALDEAGAAIGIVASGLDVPYPLRHRDLWDEVRRRGVLVSECPLGVAPARWRFPARNRLIAALGLAVVVVESKAAGGSMLTVEEALDRDVPVLAVPGSVLSPVAAGPNQLLVDGATPVRHADDIVAVLGSVVPTSSAAGSIAPAPPDPTLDRSPLVRAVLAAGRPCSLEELATASAISVDAAAASLTRLELDGVIRRVDGGYEATVG